MNGGARVQFTRYGLSFDSAFSDGHLQLLFEHFADRVDSRLQNQLSRELVVRYTAVSASLQEKNRLLAESDAQRLEAQKIAQLGNWSATLPNGELNWSETMFSVLDIDPSTKPTLSAFFERIHPADREMVEREAQALLAGGGPKELSYRLMLPDGRVKWVLARHVIDRAPDGTPVASHGTLQDVTAAKLAEETLRRYSNSLEQLVNEKVKEINDSQISTIYPLVKLAESRDDDTGDHIQRTSAYCRALALCLRQKGHYLEQLTDSFIENIYLASPLHDIGKVGIPDYILLKPGKLTPEEFRIMKTHVSIGYNTLANVVKTHPGNNFLQMGMDIAHYHHERWDGVGYLAGLAGEAIPLSARIMALSDVYDALRSRRVYKEPYPHEEALRLIRLGRATHFDPVLTDVFLEQHELFRVIFDESAHR